MKSLYRFNAFISYLISPLLPLLSNIFNCNLSFGCTESYQTGD